MSGGRISKLGLSSGLKPVFEGPLQVKHHPDRVVVYGKCKNCQGTVGQVLKVHPDLQPEYQTEVGQIKVRHQAIRMLREKHVCSFQFEGRTDVEEFLKGLRS